MKRIRKFNENIELNEKYLSPYFMELSDVYGDDITIKYESDCNVIIEFRFSENIWRGDGKGFKLEEGTHDYSFDTLSDFYSKSSNIILLLKKVARKIESEGLFQCRMFMNKSKSAISYSFVVFDSQREIDLRNFRY